MKTSKIIAAYTILSGSKLTKMSGSEKVKVIKIINAMKPTYTTYMDRLEEARKRLKPDWYTEEKESEWNLRGAYSNILTGEEKDGIIDYLKNLDLCMKDDFEKDQELTYKHITEEEFLKFAESNDFTAGQLCDLQELIG